MLVLPVRTPASLVAAPRRRTAAVCSAAKGSSPWASNPGGSGGRAGGSSGQPKKKAAAGSGDSSSSKKGSSPSKGSSPKKPKSSSSGQGFGPKPPPPPPPTYTITPPLTPQLLDELSGWETAAAPLWGTFTGHCEGEWLGQYSAYTPWGGDPEPVWADESGAYLTCAFCRVTEERQAVPADAPAADSSTDEQDSSSSSSSGGGGIALPQQQGQDASAPGGETLDLLVRSTQRSASISSLIGGVSAAAAAAATPAGAGSSAQPVAVAADDSQQQQAAGAAAAAGASAAAEDEELEAIAYNVNGSVVFNGGSYSLGPEVIQVPELDAQAVADYYDALEAAAGAATDASSAAGADSQDDDEEQEAVDPLSTLPFSTVVLEQALVTSGDRRLRLVATLKVRRPPGQELDIEIARLLLYREFWYGTTDSSSSSSSSSKRLQLLPAHKFDVPVTDLPRPQPSDLAGTWNVFVLAANLAVEENPNTLQDETVVLYSSREERQHWHVPTITSSAAPVGSNGSSNADGGGALQAASAGVAAAEQGADSDAGDAGGSFWLPGGAVVTLRMVANTGSDGDLDSSSSSSSSSSTNGTSSSSSSSSGKRARGLLVGLHMLDVQTAGSCLFLEREYDAEGVLLEVRQGSAVKGGWSGGRM